MVKSFLAGIEAQGSNFTPLAKSSTFSNLPVYETKYWAFIYLLSLYFKAKFPKNSFLVSLFLELTVGQYGLP